MITEWNDVLLEDTNVTHVWGNGQPPKGKLGIPFHLSSSRFFRVNFKGKSHVSAEGRKAIEKQVGNVMKRDDAVACMISDEPEGATTNKPVSLMRDMAKIMDELDPWHPVILGNFTISGFRRYAAISQINTLHPYPIPLLNQPRSDFRKVVVFMEEAEAMRKKLGNAAPSIFYLVQGFNYGDLIGGQRVPSYDEIRTQLLISLIMGGKGVMFYNRNAKFYPELELGTAAAAKELRLLSPVLLENESLNKSMTADSSRLRWTVRKYGDVWWILACYTGDEKQTVTMTVPPVGNAELRLAGENRSVKAQNGVFADEFKPFDVHIYTTGKIPAGYPVFADVEKAIDKVYAARKKPGNLAWQKDEDSVLKVTSSHSIWSKARRSANSALWHVTDGAFEKGDRMYFQVPAPRTGEEWLELRFHKEQTIGRVKLYPLNDSLMDYTIETEQNGRWLTVSEQKNSSGTCHDISFPAVRTKAVRLHASKSRNVLAIIEFEVYSK